MAALTDIYALRRGVPTIPVQAGIVAELRAAMRDRDQAPASARGQCTDEVIAVVQALLDETPEEP